MYEIDLFNGRNLPQRSRPVSAAAAALLLVVPATAGFFIFGSYYEHSVALENGLRRAEALEQKLEDLRDVQRFQEEMTASRRGLEDRLGEISQVLAGHPSWSPVLLTLAQSVPAGITISKLELDRAKIKGIPGEFPTYSYTLRIGVYVPARGGSGASIQHFIERLRLPTAFGAQADDIRIVLQQPESLQGHPYTLYLIECPIKGQPGKRS